MSWHSTDFSFLPFAFLNTSTVNLNKSSKGSGPDARPPKVLRGVPAGLTFDTFHVGTNP